MPALRRALLCGLLLAFGFAAEADTPAPKKSGADFMSPASRAMQADDTANPGMLWVLQGEQLWNAAAGRAGRSCASCHGPAENMRGVAARYPAFDAQTGRPVDLDARINLCRERHQQAEPLARESDDLLALAAYIGHQSRGIPIEPVTDPSLAPTLAEGERLFTARLGQLDLACASCHDDNWQGRLGGSPITQGHPGAYPLYRLEWQSLGSLQRRMRNCMVGVRAEPFAAGAPEFIALELFLRDRAAGLPVETPGVRP